MRTTNRAAMASLCIGLGVFVLLKVGGTVGAALFALGLLTVCYLGLDLFTGRCGFFIADHIPLPRLLLMLAVNLLVGYGLGWLFSLADPLLAPQAEWRVAAWDCSLEFFLKAILCGVVMYIAVALFKRGSAWGVLLGVPLFILCGFQHCIANVITLGVSHQMSLGLIGALGLCALGNFVGALGAWLLTRENTMVK